MSKPIIMIGANGHGKVVVDIAIKNGYKVSGFLDDNSKINSVMGLNVLGNIDSFLDYIDSSVFFVSIGKTDIRKKITLKLREKGAQLITLIHPAAVVADSVKVGVGTVIMAGAIINPDTIIGEGCIINTGASVDHDCCIENYVHISVGAHIAGTVKVGNKTWIGAGVTVSNNITICSECMLGVGTVVIRDIKEPGTYIGIPAKKIS